MKTLAWAAVFILALAACGDAASDSPNAAGTSTTNAISSTTKAVASTTTTSTSTTTPTTAPPVVGETQTGDHVSADFPGSSAPAYLTDVDVHSYGPFTRIVFEFDGPAPEFAIEYIDDELRKRPSDQPVELPGDSFLVITMAPASGVDLTGDVAVETYTGPGTIEFTSDAVHAMTEIEDFESHLGWAVGLEQPLPYSFTTLTDPTRLVVDLRTTDATNAAGPLAGPGAT